MKKLIAPLVMASAVVLMTGCAGISPIAGGTFGGVYTETKAPVAVGTETGWTKTGTATSTGVVCVATGDASIATAMKNGGITKIHHVDCQVKSVLWLYSEYTTVVYGD